MREIKRLNAEIDTQRFELEALYQKGQSLKQTLKAYAEVKPTIGSLNRVFLERGQELTFITALENIADTTQVTQQIKLSAAATGQTQKELPIQLDLSADVARVIRYLGGLEALDYYVNINTVRLGSAGRARAGGGAISALLLASTYFAP